MEIFAVIMAGGVGSRFWPRSKERKPKQLIRIFGENTMIQDTVKRLKGLVKNENIYVITNKIQKLRVKEQLPSIPEENIIDEPFGKKYCGLHWSCICYYQKEKSRCRNNYSSIRSFD
jgi:mannose-1-phosphate guanylyltransferase